MFSGLRYASTVDSDLKSVARWLLTAEEHPVVDNGEPEKEKLVPEVKAEEDDDLPPLDSSEEEDSDEPNEYQEDGFVVNSESDEDLPDIASDDEDAKSGSRLKRLRKGGKRRHFELDQEDLDLIAVSKGLLPSTKLKKTTAESSDPSQPSSISVAKEASTRTFCPLSSSSLHRILYFLSIIVPSSI